MYAVWKLIVETDFIVFFLLNTCKEIQYTDLKFIVERDFTAFFFIKYLYMLVYYVKKPYVLLENLL